MYDSQHATLTGAPTVLQKRNANFRSFIVGLKLNRSNTKIQIVVINEHER